jgi:hypothetical protein
VTAGMGPAGMPNMRAPAKARRRQRPVATPWRSEPGMAGNWSLQVAAKVQRESDTVARSTAAASREGL